MKQAAVTPLCCLLGVALALSPFQGARGQGGNEHHGPKPSRQKEVDARYKAALKANKGNPDKLVLPGLVADRKARSVEVLAESTGLKEHEIAEFLLVDQTSDRGYEALLWSYAKPSAVHEALNFIGLKSGTPYDPAALRFWADGDRVSLIVSNADGATFPIERLVVMSDNDAPLPEEGFVFTGSMMDPSEDNTGGTLYGADVDQTRPVASIFNDPVAVLDLPRQADRSELYGKQVVNPETMIAGGELVTLVMTPGDPAGKMRVRNLVFSLGSSAVANTLICRLAESDGKVICVETNVTPVLEKLVAVAREGGVVHVELSFGASLLLGEARKLSVVMAMLENMGRVRIKPPVAGQLYYRAFVPDKSWLTPEGRPSQPWELHLKRKKDGALAGQLVLREEIWSEDKLPVRSYKQVSFDVADAKALEEQLEKDARERKESGRGISPNVFLVFGEPAMSYGETVAFLAPVLKANRTVYVFPGVATP